MCIRDRTYTRARTYAHTHTHTRARTHSHAHTHKHARTHTYTHTDRRTHTQVHSSVGRANRALASRVMKTRGATVQSSKNGRGVGTRHLSQTTVTTSGNGDTPAMTSVVRERSHDPSVRVKVPHPKSPTTQSFPVSVSSVSSRDTPLDKFGLLLATSCFAPLNPSRKIRWCVLSVDWRTCLTVCVRACVRAYVCACVRACVRVCSVQFISVP